MIDYRIIRSNRKTLALEIKRDGEIVVRSPMHTTLSVISEFVASHEDWVQRNLQKVKERQRQWQEPSTEEIAELRAKAREILPKKPADMIFLEYFKQEIGKVFAEVLACAGVFSRDEKGMAAFDKFIGTVR